jgi:hypothetical protein
VKVCLIRSGPSHGFALLRQLQRHCDLVDVCHPQHMSIERVSIGEATEVDVRGRDLEDFDRIFFLGVPGFDLMHQTERSYAYEESYSAVLSALRHIDHLVVNAGVHLWTSGQLRTNQHFLRRLAANGWKPAGVDYRYDFQVGTLEKVVAPPARDEEKKLLILTQRSFRYLPLTTDPIPFSMLDEIRATQQWMASERIDLLGLSVALVEGKWTLYGANAQLESILELPDTADLVADVLC